MKEYVLDHDWGSYDKKNNIKQLALRNEDDALDYFKTILLPIFNMTEIDENIFQFPDNSIFEISIEFTK